jgi:hypothetical protein
MNKKLSKRNKKVFTYKSKKKGGGWIPSLLINYPYQKVENRAQTFFQDILECSTIEIKNKKINKQPSSIFIVQSDKQPVVCYLKCNIISEEPKNRNEDIKINITDISGNFIVISNNALELLKYTNLVESFLVILREYKLLKDKDSKIELVKFDSISTLNDNMLSIDSEGILKKALAPDILRNKGRKRVRSTNIEESMVYIKHYNIINKK